VPRSVSEGLGLTSHGDQLQPIQETLKKSPPATIIPHVHAHSTYICHGKSTIVSIKQPPTPATSMPSYLIFTLFHVQKPASQDTSHVAGDSCWTGHDLFLLLHLCRRSCHGPQSLTDLCEARSFWRFRRPALLHQQPPLRIAPLRHRWSQRVVHDTT
jgi:hypothetical protein